MSRFSTTFVLAGTLLGGVCLAQGTARSTPPPTLTAHAAPAQAARPAGKPAAPAQQTAAKKDRSGFKFHVMQSVRPVPPPPPTPAQMPATRPTVSYNNGQLSIVANNSNLADVLNAVHSQTGAQFDMSGVAPTDRVYVKLGPGAPKDVLAALLDGSRFNYAILGSPNDPTTVQHVVLMPKAAGSPGTTVAGAPPQPLPGGARVAQQQQQQEETDEDMPPEEEQPAEEQQQPQADQQQQEQQQPNGQNQVKTPEQLLQELQQMQQQQQQQQQQQNPDQQQQQQPPNQQPPNQQQIPDHEIPD